MTLLLSDSPELQLIETSDESEEDKLFQLYQNILFLSQELLSLQECGRHCKEINNIHNGTRNDHLKTTNR